MIPSSSRLVSPARGSVSRAVAACFTVLAPACALHDARAPADGARADARLDVVRTLLEVHAPSNPVLGAHGELFVRDWEDGVNQVWRIDPDGRRTRLTDFPDGANTFLLSPDGARVLVTAAHGGNEEDAIFVLRADRDADAAQVIEPLLARPGVVFRPQVWRADSAGFVYAANDESAEDFHLYRFDFDAPGSASGRSTKLSDRPGSWSVQDLTLDGARLLATRFESESRSWAKQLRGPGERFGIEWDVQPPGEFASVAGIGYLPGEERVLVETDWPDGTRRAWIAALEPEEFVEALPALHDEELDDTRLAPERDLLAVVVNDRGYGELHVYRLPSFEEVALPPMERGVVTLSDLRRGKLVFTLANARVPGVAYALECAGPGPARLVQLTRAEADGVELARLPAPELVTYRSFDGLLVPAFLHWPATRRAGERIPFVVHFHGGPEGQHRPGFDRTVHALLARGFGVLQPNVRGSTGYGRAYHQLDDREKRWDSVRDGVAAARWLVEQGHAEAGRIAAYGASYGGFMSIATATLGADVFGAAVDVVGIVNFESFLERTAHYRRALREAEYGALDDREFLRSISPLARVDELRCPVLIAHGLNDPRVPVGEAMQLARALQLRGLDPEQLYFEDEGHGFQKLENRALFTERMLRFLERAIGR